MLLIPSRRSHSWAAGLLGCVLIAACGVSASRDTDTDTTAADVAQSAASWRVTGAIAGFKPLYGVQEQPVTLDRRQSTCSSNGSNFCFGDNVNFCATCGICCGSSSSGYCCGADQLCCGSACCASGQTCSDGECFLPVETVVVTSAALVTVSHVATQIVTVVQAVVSTSTIFSTTDVTVTSGGTQTDVVYVTVTAAGAKRAVVVEVLEARREPEPGQDGLWNTLNLFYRRFSFPWTTPPPAVAPPSAPVQKRALRATQEALSPIASSTTVTTAVTRTSDVTSFVSTTTTVPTSSVVLVTVFQTRTSVVGAQATITTTSTLTVTPQGATTQTVTKTETNTSPSDTATSPTTSSPGSTDTGAPASSTSHSSGLSKGAIAGIAGGIGGAAVLVLALLLLWYLARRRRRAPPHQDPSSYLEPYIPDMSSPIPPPSSSPPNRYAVAGVGAAKPSSNLDRYSNISGGRGGAALGKKPTTSPRLPDMAEAPGGEVYEADGTSRQPQVPQGEIYEADSGIPRQQQQQQQPPYPVDAGEMEGSSPTNTMMGAGRGGGGLHQRNVSGASSGGAGGYVSPLSPEAGGSEGLGGGERLRNTNPYRTPGAYRDF